MNEGRPGRHLLQIVVGKVARSLARAAGVALSPVAALILAAPGSAPPVAAQHPGRLELRGRHRFARYALVFLIDGGRVRAQTYAAFPGVEGRAYRALVIGSGAHRVVTKRLLRRGAAAR
ncbi:hypothetical protein [Solirubrobacter soli]|uniref:hypothetical protein n=1 Tax=Solirubrobacter soli TaxID=363832 RepID=UPI0004096BD9|nr:hypothetical protein [Solirubrobacter soli]